MFLNVLAFPTGTLAKHRLTEWGFHLSYHPIHKCLILSRMVCGGKWEPICWWNSKWNEGKEVAGLTLNLTAMVLRAGLTLNLGPYHKGLRADVMSTLTATCRLAKDFIPAWKLKWWQMEQRIGKRWFWVVRGWWIIQRGSASELREWREETKKVTKFRQLFTVVYIRKFTT